MSASDAILILMIVLLIILFAIVPVLIRRVGNRRQRRTRGAFHGQGTEPRHRPDDLPSHPGHSDKRGAGGLKPDTTSLEEEQDLEELVGGPARKNGRPH